MWHIWSSMKRVFVYFKMVHPTEIGTAATAKGIKVNKLTLLQGLHSCIKSTPVQSTTTVGGSKQWTWAHRGRVPGGWEWGARWSMMNVLAQPTLCCSCSLQSYGTSSARRSFPMTLLRRMEVHAAGQFQPPKEFPDEAVAEATRIPFGFALCLFDAS